MGSLTAFVLGYSGALGEGGTKEENEETKNLVALVFWLGVAVGWGTGYALSTEEYILQEIPPDYNWSILKSLSRYPDEEPEYLKAIE